MPTNIRFQGLVKTTAEIESDKFAGRIGWNSTLARFVAYYTSTQYAQMARRDVLETFAQGIQDSTQTAGRLTYATTGGRLAGDAGLLFSQTGGVTRVVTIGDGLVAGTVAYRLNAPADRASAKIHQIAGVDKWWSGIAAAGSPHYRVGNYAGAALLDYPIVIEDGLGGAITLGGSAATKRDVTLTKNVKVTGQAGTGNRLVQAGTDGTQSASIPVPTAFAQTLLDDADAATARATLGLDGKVLWRDQAKDGSGFSGGWNSLLSASATKRKFAANTWAAGDCLEFEYIGVLNLNAKTLVFEWWLTPNDGTFSGSYYVVVGPSSYALPNGDSYFKLKVILTCISTGSSGAFRYSYEFSRSSGQNTSNKTLDEFTIAYGAGQVTTTNTTVDTYFDFACTGLNTGDVLKGIMSKATLNKNI